jgi:NAD(P)-dependent dehydrogenase (short-subunit alcohol dehydrogenase family)
MIAFGSSRVVLTESGSAILRAGTIPASVKCAFHSEDEAEETLPAWACSEPLRRNGTPRDTAHAVSSVLLDNGSFATGAVLPVDGGTTMGGTNNG